MPAPASGQKRTLVLKSNQDVTRLLLTTNGVSNSLLVSHYFSLWTVDGSKTHTLSWMNLLILLLVYLSSLYRTELSSNLLLSRGGRNRMTSLQRNRKRHIDCYGNNNSYSTRKACVKPADPAETSQMMTFCAEPLEMSNVWESRDVCRVSSWWTYSPSTP